MAKVLVETVSMVRHRYVVESPDKYPEHALDTVTCKEAVEMSQLFLDELIISHRVISDEKYIKMFDEDNQHLVGCTNEEKMNYITGIKK